MAGRKQVAEPREVVLHTRVTQREADEIDAWRGNLDRAAFLRLLIVMERRRRAKSDSSS